MATRREDPNPPDPVSSDLYETILSMLEDAGFPEKTNDEIMALVEKAEIDKSHRDQLLEHMVEAGARAMAAERGHRAVESIVITDGDTDAEAVWRFYIPAARACLNAALEEAPKPPGAEASWGYPI